jgi:hypothetical protein
MPLVVITRTPDEQQGYISFREHGLPVPASLGAGLYLELSQLLKATPVPDGFVLRTIKYRYAIHRDDTLQSDPIFRFEYESHMTQPEFAYCRNHLHLHRDFDEAVSGIRPSELHIPTGWVTIESVLRFLIAELGVKPLSSNWPNVLSESEEQFKKWTARDV